METYDDLMKKATKEFEIAYECAEEKELAYSYAVETDVDNDGGLPFSTLEEPVLLFSTLKEALVFLSAILCKQTNADLFDCEDFKKINYIQISMHIYDINTKIIKLSEYRRKSDTEFIKE